MNQNNLLPINNRVFVKVLDDVEEYEGELDLSLSTSKEKSNIAEIIRLPVNYSSPNQLEAGDKVIFNRHSGVAITFEKFKVNPEEYRLIKEEDILSKISAS